MLYVFAAVIGFVRLFDNPARQTFVSEMVPQDQLKNAISLNATVNNLARAIGPSIGGILIALVNIATCFFFNAVTYLVANVLLWMMKTEDLAPSSATGRKRGQLREGWRYVRSTPLIGHMLIIVAVMGTFAYEFQISLALLSDQTFQSGAGGYAALMSAFGGGAALGGIMAASRKQTGPKIFLGFALRFASAILATSIAPTLALAVAGMLLVGFFSINMLSTANSMIQITSIPEMRGRVMAMWGMAIMGSTPIGGPIIGWIGEFVGPRWALAVGGIAAFAAAAYGFYIFRNRVDEQTVPESVQPKADQPEHV
jgi:MFS family permease